MDFYLKENKAYFCTLFNKNYLSRGLILIRSLEEHCLNYHLYVFCFDKETEDYISELNPTNVTPISLQKLETSRLLQVKNSRTFTEYCWTCTPFTLRYCLENFNIPFCIYLDADIKFYNSPQNLISNFLKSDYGIYITPHDYLSIYDQSENSGHFCVQFVGFKDKQSSINVLDKWCNDCLDWCYNKAEDGKFGDQKYLDDWPVTSPEEVMLPEETDTFLGPWNLYKYKISNIKNDLCASHKETRRSSQVITYHFHSLKLSKTQSFRGDYLIGKNGNQFFYNDYIFDLHNFNKELEASLSIPEEKIPSSVKRLKTKIKIIRDWLQLKLG